MDNSISRLSLRQYAAIGRVACEWAHLEDTLLRYFEILSSLDTETSLKITSELGARTLLDMILTLAHDPNKAEMNQPAIYNALLAIQPHITTIRGERNRAVHSDWMRKGQQAVASVRFEAKGKLVGRNLIMRTTELEGLASRITGLNVKLYEILSDHRDGRLVALHPKLGKQRRKGNQPDPKGTGLFGVGPPQSSPE